MKHLILLALAVFSVGCAELPLGHTSNGSWNKPNNECVQRRRFDCTPHVRKTVSGRLDDHYARQGRQRY